MTATPQRPTLTREKKHQIVSSLARGRSVAMTAERCRVPAGIVQLLRDNYGPGLPELEAAAHALARPAGAAGAAAPRLTSADLTPEKRAAVTAWAPSVGLHVGRTGTVAQSTLDAWDRAGRPAPPLLAAITAAVATPPTGTHEPPAKPKDLTMTTTPASPTPTGPASFPAILDDLDAHITDVDNPRIVKLHERAIDAVQALADALDAHRKTAQVDAEIADLEARLAKARAARTRLVRTDAQREAASALGPGVAKAVRQWAAAQGLDVAAGGRPRQAIIDAWQAAGSPRGEQ